MLATNESNDATKIERENETNVTRNELSSRYELLASRYACCEVRVEETRREKEEDRRSKNEKLRLEARLEPRRRAFAKIRTKKETEPNRVKARKRARQRHRTKREEEARIRNRRGRHGVLQSPPLKIGLSPLSPAAHPARPRSESAKCFQPSYCWKSSVSTADRHVFTHPSSAIFSCFSKNVANFVFSKLLRNTKIFCPRRSYTCGI